MPPFNPSNRLMEILIERLGHEDAHWKTITERLSAIKGKLTRMENKIMAQPTEADLDDVLDQLQTAIKNAADRVNERLDSLNQRIQSSQGASGPQPDFSNEIAAIQRDISDLGNISPKDVEPEPSEPEFPVTPPPPPDVPDEGGDTTPQFPNEPVDDGTTIENSDNLPTDGTLPPTEDNPNP